MSNINLYYYSSELRGWDLSRLLPSLSKLLCFFNCIFLALSANESERNITRSSGASLEDGGSGGLLSVIDSSGGVSEGISSVDVCLLGGSFMLTTTSAALSFSLFSSRSGVDVHDDGLFAVIVRDP